LPIKSVDAGAGLERFCVILQDVDSVYETDILYPITKIFVSADHGNSSRSVRIMTDHIRSAVFMIADGIRPANTRMEYVLRRVIRRAILHANLSKTDPSKLLIAADKAISIFSRYYPELENNRGNIIAVLTKETSAFEKVLRQGIKEFAKIAKNSAEIVSANDAFRLHDTLGFPLELTKEIAIAQGLSIDETGFRALLKAQRERSRQKVLKP
jgi:alanyl-tRNA synthetase